MIHALAVIAVAGAGAAPPAVAAEKPRTFVIQAIRTDGNQIEFGLLAEARGSTKAVKRLGRRLKLDHFETRRKAVRVAHRMHIRLPVGAGGPKRREYARLVELKGPAFDREYLRYVLQVSRRSLAQAESQANGSGAAARLAQQIRQRLQADVKAASQAASKLGTGVNG